MISAVTAAFVIVLAVYAAFGPGVPLQHPYRLGAVFATSNDLQPGSAVRIGGLDIGTVTALSPGPSATTIVTMTITNRSVPIRADATARIDPRLVLEGNYYVNVNPGTPNAAELPSGGTIPLSHTSGIVQIDQLLDTFTLTVRDALQSSVTQFARGFGAPVRTQPAGYEGLGQAVDHLRGALTSFAQVARAAQGNRQDGLADALGSTAGVTSQLASDPSALGGAVSNFDSTSAALASDQTAVADSIGEFDALVRVAPAQLSAIDAALPSVTTFAVALRPTLRQAPAALTDTNRLLTQVGRLVRPSALPTLLRRLRPVTATLPSLQSRLEGLFPYVTLASKCISRNVVPTLDTPIQDGPNTTGQPPWEELLHAAASLASAGANSDGNGTAIRLGISESESVLRTTLPGVGPVFDTTRIAGVSPTWLGRNVNPPDHPDQWCDEQPLPNLQDRSSGVPPAQTAVSSPRISAASRDTAAVRAALLTGNPSKVIAALVPLLDMEGLKGLGTLDSKRSRAAPRARAKSRSALPSHQANGNGAPQQSPSPSVAQVPAPTPPSSAPDAHPLAGVGPALNKVLGALGKMLSGGKS